MTSSLFIVYVLECRPRAAKLWWADLRIVGRYTAVELRNQGKKFEVHNQVF